MPPVMVGGTSRRSGFKTGSVSLRRICTIGL